MLCISSWASDFFSSSSLFKAGIIMHLKKIASLFPASDFTAEGIVLGFRSPAGPVFSAAVDEPEIEQRFFTVPTGGKDASYWRLCKILIISIFASDFFSVSILENTVRNEEYKNSSVSSIALSSSVTFFGASDFAQVTFVAFCFFPKEVFWLSVTSVSETNHSHGTMVWCGKLDM